MSGKLKLNSIQSIWGAGQEGWKQARISGNWLTISTPLCMVTMYYIIQLYIYVQFMCYVWRCMCFYLHVCMYVWIYEHTCTNVCMYIQYVNSTSFGNVFKGKDFGGGGMQVLTSKPPLLGSGNNAILWTCII